MWRVVCVGPGPLDRERRVRDRGPLLTDKARADSVASFLRSTGLYESVKVEGAFVTLAAGPNAVELSVETGLTARSPAGNSLDELSSMLDG